MAQFEIGDEFIFERDDQIFDGWSGRRFRVVALNPHGRTLAEIEHYRAAAVDNSNDTGIFYPEEMKDVD